MGWDLERDESAKADRLREWGELGEWLASPPPLWHKVSFPPSG